MFEIGVIFDISKDLYYVKTKTGRYMSKARGVFRKQKFTPMVGDNVKIEYPELLKNAYIKKLKEILKSYKY